MSTPLHRTPDEWIDALLDGALTPEQQAEFHTRVSQDAGLRQAWEAQCRLDSRLKAQFHPPAPTETLAAIATAIAKQRSAGLKSSVRRAGTRPSWLSGWPIAACVALGAGGAALWIANSSGYFDTCENPQSSPVVATGESKKFDGIHAFQEYRDLAAAGFKPQFVPLDDQQLAGSLWRRCDQGLLLRAMPAGIRFLGLAECACITCNSAVALFDVHGRPAIVVIDALTFDPHYSLAPQGDLLAFRREVGRAVLYEVSTWNSSQVLDLFYDPERPTAWYRDAGGF